MKAFILVGGLGTRFGEISKSIPKPLISIGDRPILWHIIRNFIEQGTSEIYLLCRSNNINSFQDFANQVNGVVQSKLSLPGPSLEYVKVIDTGDESTTADRVILGCSRIIQDRNEKFLVTYGDSLLDIDLSKLFDFIEKKNFRMSVTAVTPPIAYATIKTEGGMVVKFNEKKWPEQTFISGGYFVFNLADISSFYSHGIELESEILPLLVKNNLLGCYVHDGFWHPMDNEFDRKSLESLIESKNAPWINW